MGQLQAFTSADNVTTRFTYSGNTGLIDTRDDADTVQQYEYNDVGHLQTVILTNGKQIVLRDGDVNVAGKLTTVTVDGVSTDYRIGEMTMSVSQGIIITKQVWATLDRLFEELIVRKFTLPKH